MSEIIAISSIAYYILWFYKYSWALIFSGLTENNILKDIYIYVNLWQMIVSTSIQNVIRYCTSRKLVC